MAISASRLGICPHPTSSAVTLPWLDDPERYADLNSSETIVLATIAEEGPINSADLQRRVPIPDRTIRDALHSLTESGLIDTRPDLHRPNAKHCSIADR